MLDTACTQLRYGLSLLLGCRIDTANLRRLASDLAADRAEYGPLGQEQRELLRGAAVAPEARRAIDQRRLRKVARRAVEGTAYYRDLFARHGLRPEDITIDGLADLPVTPRADLRASPEAFVHRRATPVMQAFTTGTTGAPTAIWFSRYELELAAASGAVSFMLDSGLGPEDVAQVNLCSRAALGVYPSMQAAWAIGAAMYPSGLIDPEAALRRLRAPLRLPGKKPRVSWLITYPSYLGVLVERGSSLGCQPGDFDLERITIGGEVVTSGLLRRAEALFGVRPTESYGMTEIYPVAGQVCGQGHLHMSPDQGLVEVLDPMSRRPVGPGELGVLTVTPYYPYRETTVLFRLVTGDVVGRLPGGGLDCELAGMPATTRVLGRLALGVEAAGRLVQQRDLLEPLETDDAVALPARYAAQPAGGGLDLHVLVRSAAEPVARRLRDRLRRGGLPLRRLRLHTSAGTMPEAAMAPVRADLYEPAFSDRRERR